MQAVISLIIIVVSLALFAYWFRYSCLLILSAQTTQDYAGVVAKASGLSVLELQDELNSGQPVDLDQVQVALVQDYERVQRLLRRAHAIDDHLSAPERFMLQLDYRLMSVYARLTAAKRPEQARAALLEQCSILSHFANAAGASGVTGA